MRLATVTLWILAGAALTGGAYWTFLITPESTIWSLAVSGLMLIMTGVLLGMTLSGAIVGWRQGVSARQMRDAASGIPAIVPAAAIVGLIWWLVGGATDRVTIYSGPINAWFIARFGWDDVSWIFTSINWLAAWLNWVVAPMLALSLMAGIMATGWRTLMQAAWITHALSPLRMVVATACVGVFVATPWLYLAPWRPAGLPATTIEITFIIAKLSVTALLMAVGAALIIRQATWTTSTSSSAN